VQRVAHPTGLAIDFVQKLRVQRVAHPTGYEARVWQLEG